MKEKIMSKTEFCNKYLNGTSLCGFYDFSYLHDFLRVWFFGSTTITLNVMIYGRKVTAELHLAKRLAADFPVANLYFNEDTKDLGNGVNLIKVLEIIKSNLRDE